MEQNNLSTISISLEKYGIKNTENIVYNPSYESLYNEELNPNLEGFEKGQLSELGAVNVMTGVFTGRSPKDKYIVEDAITKDTIWWTSEKAVNDNKAITQKTWDALKQTTVEQLSGKKLYVIKLDGKDPSDMGFENFTELVQQSQEFTFSDLFSLKLAIN